MEITSWGGVGHNVMVEGGGRNSGVGSWLWGGETNTHIQFLRTSRTAGVREKIGRLAETPYSETIYFQHTSLHSGAPSSSRPVPCQRATHSVHTMSPVSPCPGCCHCFLWGWTGRAVAFYVRTWGIIFIYVAVITYQGNPISFSQI